MMTQSKTVLALGLAAAVALAGCGDAPDVGHPGDSGAPDAGAADSGPSDAGATDAGTPDSGPPDGGGSDSGAADSGTPDAGGADSGAPDSGTPDAGPADAGPPDAGGPDAGPPDAGLSFSDGAPALGAVTVTANFDSAVLTVPAVAGAKDYRVFAISAGTQVTYAADKTEHLTGTTAFCAGIRQHNAPAAPVEVLREIEVAGLTGPTVLVVEALDRLCPFPGLIGKAHATVQVNNVQVEPAARVPFSIFTEAEVAARYGAFILNGQGPAAGAGQQAAPSDPKVLARAQVLVTPLGAAAQPAMSFFDGFTDPADQPKLVGTADDAGRSQSGQIFENKKWTWYTFAADQVQLFIDRGRLATVLPDEVQDVFASIIGVPKHAPVKLSATSYAHVTWEVGSNATSRRYWWILLCGAAIQGGTLDANFRLKGRVVPTSAFFEPDGLDPSVDGWNCFHLFPRDGWPATLAPGTNSSPETDLRVMVNKATGSATNRTNVVNLTPDQYHDASIGPPSWYRQQVKGVLTAPMLDDVQYVSPATHFDLYLRRDRAVLYVNGEQRLCNDFPSQALTMAEGALLFNEVLYHSAAERQEFSLDFWDKRGQRYYLEAAPFADQRFWDNLGFDELVPAPSNFDATHCFVHGP